MFSGTIFVRQREPDPSLQLPRSCWDVFDRLDGETAIGEIADTIGLSDVETFAVVRQLQQWDLIEEPTLSYPTYKGRGSEDAVTGDSETSPRPSMPDPSGDGARAHTTNGTTASAAKAAGGDPETNAIHLPTLWDWLKDATDNVKSYKNTQAFVLMEASDALASIGVANMDELEEMERCSDREVIEALEAAVENNVNEQIPDDCYR